MSSGSGAQHPKARLCHVIKNDNFDGYGFNLHAEKGKPGQYIGKVDEGSPAEAAGLRQGDRILEVNGVSIANENHKQVVQRIKALSGETKLLVVDPEDENDRSVGSTGSVGSAGSAASATSVDGNANGNGNAVAAEDKSASSNNGQAHKEDDHNTNGNGNGYNNNSSSNGNGTGLNLSMTAAELRAKLAAKKKFDPRKESIDFRKKFDTVQKL